MLSAHIYVQCIHYIEECHEQIANFQRKSFISSNAMKHVVCWFFKIQYTSMRWSIFTIVILLCKGVKKFFFYKNWNDNPKRQK